MTKGSKKRHFDFLGGAGDVDHSGNGPAKKRKFSSTGASAGSTGTPKHATATPAKASNGKAVIAKTPSGKQTPKVLETPSNLKGGEQQGQASARSKAKRHQKLLKKQNRQDQRASASTAGVRDSHDVVEIHPSTGNGPPDVPKPASSTLDADQARERPRKRKRKDRSSRVGVAAVGREPLEPSQSRGVTSLEAAEQAKIELEVPPSPSMAPVASLPQTGGSPHHSAPIITAQSTNEASGTTHEQGLEPPPGLSKTARKRWKRRSRSSLAYQQSSEAGGSSPMLSRMDSRQSVFASPGVLRQPAAASSTADPELGVKLPDPPAGLNEHQRKLWIDRVRRVTLDILTPSKASQRNGGDAAYANQPEAPQSGNKKSSPTALISSQQSVSRSVKVRDPELWRQATTTTLVAAPEKRWVHSQTELATTSISDAALHKATSSPHQALPVSSGAKEARAESEPADSEANVQDQKHSVKSSLKHDQPEEAKEDSSESDAEKSDSDEADQGQETPDVEDLAQNKTGVSQITQIQETAQAQDQDAGTSSSESENEESDDASEADNAAPTTAAPKHASPSHEDEASRQQKIPAANGHQLGENGDASSSPVAFDDDHEDDPSHDEDDVGDEGLEPDAHQTKDEEMFPSSAPVLNRPRTSQSTIPTGVDDSEGLDSDVTRDRQSPPRIKFSAKSFKLGNAANALGYSVKPAARSATSPKAKQVDARDAFRRFSSFVEGSDSEDSDESNSDDESEKSAGVKNGQPVVAKVVAQKPLSSQVIPDSQSGNGLQVQKAVTSSAPESKVRDFAHLPLVPDSQPLVPTKHDKMQHARQDENKHAEHDEDSDDDDVEEDDDEAEAHSEINRPSKQARSSPTTRPVAPTTADSRQEIDASSDSDSDEESASDNEEEDDEEESDESSDDDDDDNEDDVGGAAAPQDKGLMENSMPNINGHRNMDQAQTSQNPATEHRQGQQRKAGSAEAHGTGSRDDAAESSDDSTSSEQDPDDEQSEGETHGSFHAKTTADIDMADGIEAAIDGPAQKQDAADKSDLQPAATWSFEALAENSDAIETHIVAADTSNNNQHVSEPTVKPGNHTAVQDRETDVIGADMVAQDAGDVVELPADVDGSDDKKVSDVGEDEGSAASGEEDDAEKDNEEQEESEQEEQAPATTEAVEALAEDDSEQHPVVLHEQSIYAAASQPEWRKITEERVKAQLLGELAASQSEDAGEVHEAMDHANKRGRKRAMDDVTKVNDEIGDYVDASTAQGEAADVLRVDIKRPIGFTAINKQADQTSKLQPESTGKLKRPSAFLEHRSGGSGSGQALARVRSSQRIDSSPTVVKKTSFTFGENDDEELDRSISEIQKDVFESTRALPFSIDQSDKPDDRLAGGLREDLAVDSSHGGLRSRRQLVRVVIPPVQPEDYNNILVYSADVPEPDDAPVSESEKPGQIANHRLPSQAAEASGEQPVPADDAEPSRSIKANADKPETSPNLAPRDPNDPDENAVKCYACSKDGRRCLKPVAGEADPRCRRCLNRKVNCVSYEEGLRRAQMRKDKLKQPKSGKRFEESSREKPRKNGQEQSIEEPEEQSEEAPQEQPKAKPKKSPKEKSKKKSKEQPEEQLKENPKENLTLTTAESNSAQVEYTLTDDADRCYGCASRNCRCYRPPPGHEDPRCKACVSRKRPCRTYQEGLEISNQRQAAKQQKELAALHFDDVDASIVNAETKAAAAAREAAAKAMPPPANPRKRKTTGMTSRHFSPAKRSKHDQSMGHDRASVDLDTSTVVSEDVSAAAREEEATEHIILPKKTPKPRKKSKSTGTKSPHFLPLHLLDRVDMPTPSEGRLPAGVSRAAVPPIASARFGIIQEKLWNEPFWLIIAVTFLNKTAGRAAAPTFWKLKEQYKTPEALAEADQDELHDMIQHLGLQNQRARRLLAISKAWVEEPPVAGKRHKTMNYPVHGDHAEFKGHPKGTPIDGDVKDCKGALEIGHIPGCGPYAWDSWRIFCRDVLRGAAEDYNGKGAADESFEPEWKRVLPLDKELVATLRWMWLREGWIWDHKTGEKRRANDEEMERAEKGEMEVADVQEGKFAAQAAGAEKIYEPTIANGQDDEEGEDGSESDVADEADGGAVSEADSSDTDVPAKPREKAGRKSGSSEQ